MTAPESVESVDLEIRVAAERFNRAIVAWNFYAAQIIQETKDKLLDKRLELMQQRAEQPT